MRKTIITVIGPGDEATQSNIDNGYRLGQLIAREKWVLVTGGRMSGVMDSTCRGAKEEDPNSITIGILAGHSKSNASPYVDIPIPTDLGHARNAVNVLAADVVIACGMSAGTASEVALAIKSKRQVVLVDMDEKALAFFLSLSESIMAAENAENAIAMVRDYLLSR